MFFQKQREQGPGGEGSLACSRRQQSHALNDLRKEARLGSSEGLVAPEEDGLGRVIWNLRRMAQKGKPEGIEAGRRPPLSGFSYTSRQLCPPLRPSSLL